MYVVAMKVRIEIMDGEKGDGRAGGCPPPPMTLLFPKEHISFILRDPLDTQNPAGIPASSTGGN